MAPFRIVFLLCISNPRSARSVHAGEYQHGNYVSEKGPWSVGWRGDCVCDSLSLHKLRFKQQLHKKSLMPVLCQSVQGADTGFMWRRRERGELLPEIMTNYFHLWSWFAAAPLLATPKNLLRVNTSNNNFALFFSGTCNACWGHCPK